MKNKSFIAKVFLALQLAIISLCFAVPTESNIVYAATADLGTTTTPTEYALLEPLPCLPSTDPRNPVCSSAMKTTIDVKEYINYIFRLAIAVAAFLSVLMFTVGGFQYMTSEAWGGKDEGKSRMKNAVLGLLAALISYVVLYTIDPRLVEINSEIPKIVVPTNDIFGNLDSSIAATNARLDEIRHSTVDAIKKRDSLNLIAADARTEAERIQYLIDNGGTSEEPLTEAEIESMKTEVAQLKAKANQAEDMAKVVTWQQSIKDDYLRALNTTKVADVRALEDRILKNYASNVASYNLNNPADPLVSEMEARLREQKSIQLNSLENYISELSVTQKTYTTGTQLEAAKTAAIEAINNRTNAKIAKIDDPVLKQQYLADAGFRIEAITAVTKTAVGTAGSYLNTAASVASPAVFLTNTAINLFSPSTPSK